MIPSPPGPPPTSLSAAHSPEAVTARLEEYARQAEGAFAPKTLRAIATDTRIFATWCETNGRHYGPPAFPETVAAFVAEMAQTRRPATVGRYVSSIDHLHRAADLPPPGASNAVRLALKAMRRARGTKQKQAPALRWERIGPLLADMGTTLLDLRDAALIAVAYDTFGRASELVALDVKDIQPEGSDGVAFIARSKTDQEGAGSYRFIARDTLARVRAWVEAVGLEEESPLFIPLSTGGGQRLTTRDVSRILERRFGAVRDHKGQAIRFSAHSTRVGAASDALAAGLSSAAIQQAGGWKSERMVVRYTERLAVGDGAAARMARAQGRA